MSEVVVNGLATLPYPPGVERGGWTATSLAEAMRAGGVTAANVTLAVDGGFERTALAVGAALAAFDGPDAETRVLRTPDDLERSAHDGVPGVIMGFQNSTPLEGDLDKLEFFQTLGVRVIQLTYQRRTLAADGCGEPADAGLSRFGRSLVARMNELGVVIDLSHTGRRSALETIDASAQPVVFSHANVASVAPHLRNRTDEEIRELAAGGGVIGITAISRFLAPATGRASVADLVDHVERVVDLVGIEHVGIGLDITEGLTRPVYEAEKRPLLDAYPELEGTLDFENYYAAPIRSMADVGVIADALSARGYTRGDVARVLGENFRRVFDEVWSAGPGCQRAVQPPSTTIEEPVR